MSAEDKKFYHQRYKHQRAVVAGCKEKLRQVPSSRRKERKPLLQALYTAKELLLKYKEEWQKSCSELKQERTHKKETQALIAQAVKGRKKALKQLRDVAPPSPDFSFRLIKGPILKFEDMQAGAKTWLGRWTNGAPCHRGRQGFIQEVELKDHTGSPGLVKKLMQAYYKEHEDFFGKTIVYFTSLNMGSPNVWGIACTTDRKNIRGFAPRLNLTKAGGDDDE